MTTALSSFYCIIVSVIATTTAFLHYVRDHHKFFSLCSSWTSTFPCPNALKIATAVCMYICYCKRYCLLLSEGCLMLAFPHWSVLHQLSWNYLCSCCHRFVTFITFVHSIRVTVNWCSLHIIWHDKWLQFYVTDQPDLLLKLDIMTNLSVPTNAQKDFSYYSIHQKLIHYSKECSIYSLSPIRQLKITTILTNKT